jgi:large subunit ribosomal protein L6
MSRVGNQPIPVPDNVKVAISGRRIDIEGPKGKLSMEHHELMRVRVDAERKCVLVERPNDQRMARSLHGTTRSLIANMVQGVANGYERGLELYGVGYSVAVQGRNFSLTCGYSHPIVLTIPAGVEVDVATPQARGDTEPARFKVRGCDKQAVGEFAARCRKARKPEPYKGKGVRYAGERIVRKVGKAFAGAAS